jgi:hypothetical protein
MDLQFFAIDPVCQWDGEIHRMIVNEVLQTFRETPLV